MRCLISLFLFLAFACGPVISVYNDYDRGINLSAYKSFAWKATTEVELNQNPLYYNELNDKRIKNAVNAAMENKGYKLVSETPQLLVHYHIIIEDKSVVTQEPYGHQYSPYWMAMDINSYQYKEGTLIIDLMESTTNELVWRGWSVAALEELRPENIEKKLNKTIERIFEALPHSSNVKADTNIN